MFWLDNVGNIYGNPSYFHIKEKLTNYMWFDKSLSDWELNGIKS